ncbi:hypothetical protein KAW65_05230 [candidate division WOR-3 bacterium]|nr:hypothetical protein [candidate division WOR-3 bacterium]
MGIVISTILFFASPRLSNGGQAYTVRADSSILADSITYLYGNVEFYHQDWEIRANYGIITKNRILAQDSISMIKGELKIFGDFGEYFWNGKIKLYNGFVAHKGYETVTGETGEYLEDKLCVHKSVKYTNNKEKVTVSGDEGFYNFNTHYGMMTVNPKFSAPEDSIEVLGDTIKLFSDTLVQVKHNAVVNLPTTHCFAENLTYLPKKNEVLLFGKPQLISTTDSLGGEKIKIILENRKIKKIIVENEVWGKRWQF